MVERVTGHGSPVTAAQALALLHLVKDPEVPVLSVVELGVVRAVAVEDNSVTVTITPTYSGCPAMHAIEHGITEALEQAGFERIVLKTVYAPAWTSDWLSDTAKAKLQRYGIAPPRQSEVVSLGTTVRSVACPHCGSAMTELVSEFGATACKALYRCRACREPFEHFKEF
jgi:ring-1,2-phenylacetyl-CoA epoxidase subunit PaaD